MAIEFGAAVLEAHSNDRPYGDSRPLRMQTVRADGPGPGEVLVRIDAASLCRSDLSVITGVRPWPLPIVPGHEASGTVEETGRDVSLLSPGDRVVLVYQPRCGTCPCCVAGRPHLCDPGLAANRAGALLTGGPRLSVGGEPLHHHMGLSAFAERAVVAEQSLVRVDPDIEPEIAALFGCAVMCGAGSAINTAAIRPGESVVVVGVGGVGASAILGAHLAGAGRIIAVDPDAGKRRIAGTLGASDTVPAGVDAAAAILEMTGGGADCTLETAGTVEAFETAYGAARRGGRIVTVGMVSPATPFSLDIAAHVTGAKTIAGSYMGSCNPALDIPRFVALYRSGRFPVDRLITHRLALAEVNLALDRMADSKALRQILLPHG